MALRNSTRAARWNALFGHGPPGPASIGWLTSGSPIIADILATCGFRAVCVDCQHGAAGGGSRATDEIIRRVATSPAAPLARPEAVNAAAIGRLLDAGCRGVIAPMIRSVADAETLVSACRYPPYGTRSSGPYAAIARGEPAYGAGDHSKAPIALAMIETREALDAVDDIARVQGLDGLFVGPVDLSQALGLNASAMVDGDKVLLEAMAHVRGVAAAHHIKTVVFAPGGSVARCVAEGWDAVCPGADLVWIRDAATRQAGLIHELDAPTPLPEME